MRGVLVEEVSVRSAEKAKIESIFAGLEKLGEILKDPCMKKQRTLSSNKTNHPRATSLKYIIVILPVTSSDESTQME